MKQKSQSICRLFRRSDRFQKMLSAGVAFRNIFERFLVLGRTGSAPCKAALEPPESAGARPNQSSRQRPGLRTTLETAAQERPQRWSLRPFERSSSVGDAPGRSSAGRLRADELVPHDGVDGSELGVAQLEAGGGLRVLAPEAAIGAAGLGAAGLGGGLLLRRALLGSLLRRGFLGRLLRRLLGAISSRLSSLAFFADFLAAFFDDFFADFFFAATAFLAFLAFLLFLLFFALAIVVLLLPLVRVSRAWTSSLSR